MVAPSEWPWKMAMLAAACLFVSACERVDKVSANPPGPPVAKQFATGGVVKKVDRAKGRAVIAQAEIPGYMEAMTMEFQATEATELKPLVPGDRVTFRLTVSDRSSAIDEVHVVGHTPLPPDDPAGTPAPELGMPMPDGALIDDQGRPLHLADFRGRVVAFTFFYTRCPLPDFCPRMNSQLAAVGRELAKGGESRWQLLSVTMDPEYDTPAVLAGYAPSFRTGELVGHWSFVTGVPAEMERLGASVGLAKRGAGDFIDHNLRTGVIGKDGKLRRVFLGNEWSVGELVAEMQQAMKAE